MGKTVLMLRCAQIARDAGHMVLGWQGQPQTTLHGILTTALQMGPPPNPGLAVPLTQLTNAHDAPGIARTLSDIAAAQQERTGAGMILCIDEVQMLSPQDLTTFLTVLTRLRDAHPQAPVLFVGAGLPATHQRIAQITRAHDLPDDLVQFHDLPQNLTADQVAEALRPVARRHGVDWHPEALEAVHRATLGHPAHVQLLAAEVWTRTTGLLIQSADVHHALPAAGELVDTMYVTPRWSHMPELQRAYLTAVALCAHPAETDRVSAMLEQAPERLADAHAALLRAGDLYSPRDGHVGLAHPLARFSIPMRYNADTEGTPSLPYLEDMARARDSW
ncbi:hypothetical protein I6I18_10530 [Kytococcus sedentarius]|uniref:AAA+ ATPase domain-containing protein n=2 Tax=Bacteria TaxID=2 RepID=C7NGB8_KYTSD|nr:hypothetical protein [Kytococcus sedentarius]ACV07527.1 hypothetical protein Ksed_25650 [Kytococcus sedentarius DSM 20547]QQB63461.1 hypothetical protein I6I18_10530 [Kytococcus sedentarius]